MAHSYPPTGLRRWQMLVLGLLGASGLAGALWLGAGSTPGCRQGQQVAGRQSQQGAGCRA